SNTNWISRMNEKADFCDRKITFYGNSFAMLRGVLINKTLGEIQHSGDKFASDKYKYKRGFFTVNSTVNFWGTAGVTYPFIKHPVHYRNHLNEWNKVIISQTLTNPKYVRKEFFIAITRYEYLNIWHAATDIYGAFLLTKFFNKSPETVNILIVDDRPPCYIDPVWKALFNSTTFYADLPDGTYFKNLAWSMVGYSTPMSYLDTPILPYFNDFHNFMLRLTKSNIHFSIQNTTTNLNHQNIQNAQNIASMIDSVRKSNKTRDFKMTDICDDITIAVLWRHEFNRSIKDLGPLERKISNEEELIRKIRVRFQDFTVVDFDPGDYTPQDQAALFTQVDILIGMHGAGLTNILYMAPFSGLIELFPFGQNENYFRALTRWRQVYYMRWMNIKPELENTKTHFTHVTPEEILHLIDLMKTDLRKHC
ncbi:unnamed protein product, partial [Owenia fusiformis]